MAEKKRYIIKSLVDNTSNQIGRSIENNLLSLSRIGIKWDQSLIKNMRGIGAMETENANDNTNYLGLSQLSDAIQERYNKTASVAGQNEFIAFFDKNYETRRDFLRKFSSQGEIDFLEHNGGVVIPVEVKAEENLRAQSLKVYCEKFKPEYAVRTSMSNYREQNWLINLPLYAICNL